eukprot:TRINITY_DN1080_c0_g4_i1.p1 TRINITY_DN1080_c0_g4~~TRINITY_DN1080_c0_g4_i1.p1  ORF type:complete len:474 (+),score=75.33 TRINITY_DN1080_c0_g4_i1:2-1423(+)
MCACRRRDSGMRYDGGWVCQNDRMVQEAPQYTNPIWADEFDDERGDGSLNESRWVLTYSGSGNGNNEKQFYTKRRDNLYIQDGVLKIVGKREGYGGKGYTSGKITSKGKGEWGPGTRYEIRAKLPLGVGTWPALWMMPTDSNYGTWPDSGEIDIMEAVGKRHGKVFGTIHTGAYNHMRGTHKGKSFYTDYSEWHTYALDWHEDRLVWYADGNKYNEFAPDNIKDYAKWPFNRRFYLIFNLAVGGNLGGGINFGDDQVMEIDYVRVFCLDGSMSCKTEQITCCGNCPGKKHCSQKSGSCYNEKRQWYYDTCDAHRVPTTIPTTTSCCDGSCSGRAFCSPQSGTCYDSKRKSYYKTCGGEAVEPANQTTPVCCGTCQGRAFCSPRSGSCYDTKRRSYYETCGGEPQKAACCGSCGGKGYCSPRSKNCYERRSKSYYEKCSDAPAACCGRCGNKGFCSPVSNRCYTEKAKAYYESC